MFNHMGFSVFSTFFNALPLLFQSWGPQKPNQFKQVSWWNAKYPQKVTAPVAKRYVKQHATALFKATSFRLKGLHVRPVQSQSAKERSVILSNIPFMYLIEYPSRQ